MTQFKQILNLEPKSIPRIQSLCGATNNNLSYIEDMFNIKIGGHDFELILMADCPDKLNKAQATIVKLYELTAKQNIIELEDIYRAERIVKLQADDVSDTPESSFKSLLRGKVKPLSAIQNSFVSDIFNRDVTFGVGPAGTGKTFLAVAAALQMLHDNQIRKIVLTRPAIEAGERLGFLPGDLSDKLDPYLRPLFDALEEILGDKSIVTKLMEKGIVEIAPLAYMRGRTLKNAFIILDEAQNTTQAQMKMFLTRLGHGSKMVVTGDLSQVDLPNPQGSGLKHVLKVLNDNHDKIGIHYLSSRDIVRHPTTADIVQAYQYWEDAHKELPRTPKKSLQNLYAELQQILDSEKETKEDNNTTKLRADDKADNNS